MAANRIKGITIEIGGDATPLNKALSSVDKNLKSTQTSLRDVNKLLKLDPGNITLLGQKEEYLNKQIEETKNRLSTAKDALEQLKKTNGPDNVTEEQKALEREIAATEQSLKSAEKELKNFGSVGEQQAKLVAEKMGAIGEKVTKAGETMTKGLTVPIVAAGGASVAAWKEVDEAMDTVTKKTGASGKALEEMQAIAKKLAENIPTDFQSAADAVGEVNTRFGLTGKALEDLSGKFVKFAQLNDTDVSTSIDGVQKAMAAFNVPADKAGEVLDLLTKVGQDTGLSMDTLEGTLVKNSTALQEMGFDLSNSAVFLGNLEKSGADSATVMTGLKKALQNATKEGKPMSTAMQEIQKSILGAKTDTEAAQTATELFGAKAGPAISKAVREGRLSFEDLGKSLTDYSGTVSDTFDETLDPLDKMQTTMNSLKLLGTDIVETSAPMLEKAMSTLRDIVKDLSDRWNGLTEGQQEMIIKAALVVAALGPIVTVVGNVITVASKVLPIISSIQTAITAAGGLIPALSALAAGAAPFLAAGAVVVGIIAAAALIIKNWDKIKEAMGKLNDYLSKKWDAIKKKTAETWNNVKTATVNAWNTTKTAVSNAAVAIQNGVKEKFNSAKTAATNAFTTLKTNAVNALTTAKTSLSAKAEEIKTDLATKFETAKETATGKFEELRKNAVDKFGKIKKAVSSAGSKIMDVLNYDLGDAVVDAAGSFGDLSSTVKNTLKTIKEKLSNFGWKIPAPKLPHISLEYGEATVFGRSIRYPKGFDIEWYRRAYDQPIMFTRPTVLQTPYGAKGFGDGHGGEVVLSEDKLRQIAGSGAPITVNVYGSPGMDVNRLADAVQNRLVALQRQREAAGIA